MEESSYIHKSDNVTVLIYHLVTPAKYRRVIFKEELDDYLCKICEDIEARYEIRFLEIGVDNVIAKVKGTSKLHEKGTREFGVT